MIEKPELVLTEWLKGEPIAYKCSRCGRMFLLPENLNSKEGVAKLWMAFQEHIRDEHPDQH